MVAVTPETLPLHDEEWLEENFALNSSKGQKKLDGPAAEKLGKGWHGSVQKIKNKHTQDYVALKTQPWRFYHEDSEWRIQSMVRSEHVAKLYGCVRQSSCCGLTSELKSVMELGDETLENYIETRVKTGLITFEVACQLFAQILKGLSDCHAQHIYHRDVKPANMVLRDGRVKLIDFGKSVHLGPCLRQRAYEDSDVRRACAIFCRMLPPPQEKEFRAWMEGRPRLRVDKVMHHPWLAPLFGVAPWEMKPPRPIHAFFAMGWQRTINFLMAWEH